MFSLLLTPAPKLVPTTLRCTWLRPGLKLFIQARVQLPVQPPLPPSTLSPPPHGACPTRGQKEVSTQHARCWIGCYFSRPTGPDPARGGGGGLWGQDMQGGVGGGQNFPVFYPFATWSPIERNGTLRANRRGWPGSGPPARPQESCPLQGGEGKSSRNQRRNRRGKGSCQQTRLHHVTRQRHGNTRQRTRLHSGQGLGVGGEGSRGPPILSSAGRAWGTG